MPRKTKKTADDYTRAELYARAEAKGIKYRSRMNKQQLLEALGLGGAAAKPKRKAAAGAAKSKPAAKKKVAAKAPTRKAAPKKKAAALRKPAKAAKAARPVAASAATSAGGPAKKPVVTAAPRTQLKATVKATATVTAKSRKPAGRAAPAVAEKTAAREKLAAAAAEPALPSSSVVPPPPPAAAAAAYIDRGPALPGGYGEDRIVALVRDPRCIFAYWELGGGGYERVRGELGDELVGGVWVLRLVKVAGDRFFDVPIDPAIGNWYLHVEPSERYQVKIGVVLPSGIFRELAASAEVVTPAEQVSDVIDEEWMLVREEFDRLVEQILSARVPGGVGSSEILHRLMGLPRRMALFSGAITSPRGGR